MGGCLFGLALSQSGKYHYVATVLPPSRHHGATLLAHCCHHPCHTGRTVLPPCHHKATTFSPLCNHHFSTIRYGRALIALAVIGHILMCSNVTPHAGRNLRRNSAGCWNAHALYAVGTWHQMRHQPHRFAPEHRSVGKNATHNQYVRNQKQGVTGHVTSQRLLRSAQHDLKTLQLKTAHSVSTS